MDPKFTKKSEGVSQEDSSFKPDVLKIKETNQEKEQLSEQEKEQFKREVLKEIEKVEGLSDKTPKPVVAQQPFSHTQPSGVKSESLIEIESILEQDLSELYFRLEPENQQRFKLKGEETALKIEKLLKKTKVKTKEIFKLIVEWLKIVPGVNRFFIKQEAKIKTNQIINLKKR